MRTCNYVTNHSVTNPNRKKERRFRITEHFVRPRVFPFAFFAIQALSAGKNDFGVQQRALYLPDAQSHEHRISVSAPSFYLYACRFVSNV